MAEPLERYGDFESGHEADGSRVLEFVDEGATSPVRLRVTHALAEALTRAAAISGEPDFDVSFSSLWLGLIARPARTEEEDAVLRFISQAVGPQSEFVSNLATRAGKSGRWQEAALLADAGVLARPLKRTDSARRAFGSAVEIAGRQHSYEAK